jgi:hypothetical protein
VPPQNALSILAVILIMNFSVFDIFFCVIVAPGKMEGGFGLEFWVQAQNFFIVQWRNGVRVRIRCKFVHFSCVCALNRPTLCYGTVCVCGFAFDNWTLLVLLQTPMLSNKLG